MHETIWGADMNLDRLNRWMTLAANIGVLAGILFLSFELRQNTMASRLQAASNFQDSFSEIEFFIAQSPEFAALLIKGREGEELTNTGQFRLTVFYGNVLRTWQNTHLQYLSGALDKEIWRGSQARLTVVLNDDRGLLDHWQTNKSQFSPVFNDMISSIILAPEEN